MLDILWPPLRILGLAAFLLLAKAGWFTWLTPENAHDLANQVMDFLVVAVPAGYALWAWFKARREQRETEHAAEPVVMIAATAALPEVRTIEVRDPELADAVPSDKVKT